MELLSETTSCPTCRLSVDPAAAFCPGCGTPRTSNGPSLVGATVGERYRILEKIGEGNSGEIYRAEHVTLKRRVAIKVLHERLSRDELAIERFRREATTVAELDNEHIVEILDFGRTADRRLYLAMEFLEGETLSARMTAQGPMPTADVLAILSQLSKALMEAHAMGYVHRDLRPKNIFLCQRRGHRDFVKLLDFGLAKLVEPETGAASTSLGMTFGDPGYMSPEQAKGDPVDRRADIYSLGCIAFEMLCGHPAFRGETPMEVLSQKINGDAPDPSAERSDLPPWLNQIILRMLAKAPEERFITVHRLLQAMDEGQTSGAVMTAEIALKHESTPPPSVTQAMERLASRTEASWHSSQKIKASETGEWFTEGESGNLAARHVSFEANPEYEEPKRTGHRALWIGGTLVSLVLLLGGLLYALPGRDKKPAPAPLAQAAANPPVIIVDKETPDEPVAPVPVPVPVPVPETAAIEEPKPDLQKPDLPKTDLPKPKPKPKTEKPKLEKPKSEIPKTDPTPDPAAPLTATENRQRAEYFAKLGLRALRTGDTTEAAEHFRKARELDPQCAQALVGMGELAITQGSHEQALAHLQNARRLAPGSTRIETLLGQTYLALGDKERAKSSFEEALRLDPGNVRAQEGLKSVTGQ